MNSQLSFEEFEKLWNEFEDVPIDKDNYLTIFRQGKDCEGVTKAG